MVPLYPVLYIVPLGVTALVLELLMSFKKDFDGAGDVSTESLAGST